MQLDWITHPLVTDTLFACGLSASVVLFYSLKREICRVRQGSVQGFAALSGAMETANENLAALRAALEKFETAQAVSTATMEGEGKRARAVGMIDHGEPSGMVAQSLGMSECEVDLLLKVNQMLTEKGGRQKASKLSVLSETPA